RFCETKAEGKLATRDLGQQLLLLLEGAVRNDSVTAVCERAKHPHRELFEMPAGFLEQYGQFDRGAAAAAPRTYGALAKHHNRGFCELRAVFLEKYANSDRGPAAAAVLNGQVEPEPS